MNQISNVNLHGSAQFSESNTFSFRPILPQMGQLEAFKRNGTAQQLTDGSFEFQPRSWSRSRAELIKLLPHGRLTKTQAGDYLLTIRIPDWESQPMAIVADESLEAISALRNYIYEAEVAA